MKNTNQYQVEITFEIKLRKMKVDSLTDSLRECGNISEVHIVSYNGEVSG